MFRSDPLFDDRDNNMKGRGQSVATGPCKPGGLLKSPSLKLEVHHVPRARERSSSQVLVVVVNSVNMPSHMVKGFVQVSVPASCDLWHRGLGRADAMSRACCRQAGACIVLGVVVMNVFKASPELVEELQVRRIEYIIYSSGHRRNHRR